ncbi:MULTISPECIES: hypothetical protein [unclassified Caballeronia]|uniref:hypothetical protein n=1 Tax=unclassified Caballeronia TaxID=2646786 RepID=UPI0020299F61|nr:MULTISPECIES: hypothetical protein [unclassified Caballeronia]
MEGIWTPSRRFFGNSGAARAAARTNRTVVGELNTLIAYLAAHFAAPGHPFVVDVGDIELSNLPRFSRSA